MLSILIPIYNVSVVELVNDLHRQCASLCIEFEIIAIDDKSNSEVQKENAAISSLPHVTYEQLSTNIGRAKIRNLLAEKAAYPYLLFLDCDAQIVSSDFIEKYVQHCQGKHLIVCGGICYSKERPSKDCILRWLYGQKHEKKSAAMRQKHPLRSFSAFNLLLSEDVFGTVQFDESLSQYGHEDTLFGYHLQKHGFSATHIDNPLRHTGLDANDTFVEKNKQAIQNLLLLSKTQPADFPNHVKILTLANKLERLHLIPLMSFFYSLFDKRIARKLHRNPSLWCFNLFKIGYFCLLKSEKQ